MTLPTPGAEPASGDATDGEQAGSPDDDTVGSVADSASGEQPATSPGGDGPTSGQREAPDGGQQSDDEILAKALEALRGGSRTSGEAGTDGPAAPGTGGTDQAVPASAQSGPGGPDAGPLTDAEKARRLNQELERQFAEFDELMRREREAASRQASAGGGGGAAGGSGAAGGGGLDGEAGETGTAMADSGMANRPPGRSSGVPGTGDSDIPVDIPADIGSTRDDDIIARQLREAAMKEQDPVLREKLWDEYRKYKSGGS